MSHHPAHRRGPDPAHVVQVWDGDAGCGGARVRSLAAGLVARGLRVTVCAPPGSEHVTPGGAHYVPLPHRGVGAAVVLRSVCADADLVHAHGVPGALLASLALPLGRPAGQRVPLVVSWEGSAASGRLGEAVLRGLERWALRRAAVVLATTPVEAARARRHGARDARLARDPMASLTARFAGPAARLDRPDADRPHGTATALGLGDGPLLLVADRSVGGQRSGTLPSVSRVRRWLTPRPWLAVAGGGPARAARRRRVRGAALPVRLLGGRDDVPDLLTVADVTVVATRRGARSPGADQGPRTGVPLALPVPGEPRELPGGGALLVVDDDVAALVQAAGTPSDGPRRGAGEAVAGRELAAHWPTEEQALAHVLSVYDELLAPARQLATRPGAGRPG